jgi:hypothetical protein
MVGGDLPHDMQDRSKLKEPDKLLARSVGSRVRRVSEILRQAEPRLCPDFHAVASILAPFRAYG